MSTALPVAASPDLDAVVWAAVLAPVPTAAATPQPLAALVHARVPLVA